MINNAFAWNKKKKKIKILFFCKVRISSNELTNANTFLSEFFPQTFAEMVEFDIEENENNKPLLLFTKSKMLVTNRRNEKFVIFGNGSKHLWKIKKIILCSITINSKKRRKKKGEKRIQRVHSSVTSMKANCGQRLESRASHYRGISTLLRSHRWHRNEANSVRLLKHCANMFFQQSRNDDLD